MRARPRPITFRARLTAAMAALALAVLLLTSAAIYLGARQTLQANLDAELLSVARAKATAALGSPGSSTRVPAGAPAPLALAPISGYERFAQIEDGQGRVMARTGNLTRDLSPGTSSLPEVRARAGRITFSDLTLAGEPLRCIYYPLRDWYGRPLLAVVGISRLPTEHSLTTLLKVLLASFLIGCGAAAYGAARLARRITQPLGQIAAAARGVSDTSLSARIPQIAREAELRDVTAGLNEMLARLEAAFAAQQVLIAAQRRFVSDASHELRSPLTNMRTTVEVALRRRRAPAEYEEMLVTVQGEIERLSRLADDLLTLSRAEAGQFQICPAACELSGIVRQALAAHRADAQRVNVHLRQEGAPTVPVLGDRDRLRQVVDNLLDNALRYAPPGSSVVLKVRREGDCGRLEVQDQGPGVPAEDQAHIFDRFYRVDSSRDRRSGGLGLGLAIVKAIVESHQGRVGIQSQSGNGTTVRVDIPAASPSEPGAEHDEPGPGCQDRK